MRCCAVLVCCMQDSDISAELHATTLVALLEHLQLQDVTLVMHDWGGEWLSGHRCATMCEVCCCTPS